MSLHNLHRRTGTMITGVVPPTGHPLPQESVGVVTWIGSPAEFKERRTRARLLHGHRLRHHLRSGHLAQASELALRLDTEPERAPLHALLRLVAATLGAEAPEAILRSELPKLPTPLPRALLTTLMGSTLDPDLVAETCLAHDPSPATRAAVRLLRVHRAAKGGEPSLKAHVSTARSTPMHASLHTWAEATLTCQTPSLLEALLPNLPLVDPKNHRLHKALTKIFKVKALHTATQRQLTRRCFSSWIQLREAHQLGAALHNHTAQVANLRLVFERLLQRCLLPKSTQGPSPTMGLDLWCELLFQEDPPPHPEAREIRRRLRAARGLSHLQPHLEALLRAHLHIVPRSEAAAWAAAPDLLGVVIWEGFQVSDPGEVPRSAGLIPDLVRALP